jgi:hypothetical protein
MKVEMIRLCSWREEQNGEEWKRKRQMNCLMKKIPLSRILGEEIYQTPERVPTILCTH